LLATVTQAQASSFGVDGDPMTLSWFHVIVSFVVTGILLFCGWIATMKRGQEELLPGMGDEEDRETNDYNSEKSSESRVNKVGNQKVILKVIYIVRFKKVKIAYKVSNFKKYQMVKKG